MGTTDKAFLYCGCGGEARDYVVLGQKEGRAMGERVLRTSCLELGGKGMILTVLSAFPPLW